MLAGSGDFVSRFGVQGLSSRRCRGLIQVKENQMGQEKEADTGFRIEVLQGLVRRRNRGRSK